MVLGKVLGTTTLAWVQGLIFLAFAPLAGIPLTVTGLLATSGVIFAIAFLFTAFGFTLAWRMESTQGFHAIVNLILFPLWMVSGAVFTAEESRRLDPRADARQPAYLSDRRAGPGARSRGRRIAAGSCHQPGGDRRVCRRTLRSPP